MNGTRWAISPETNATSRESRSSLETRTQHWRFGGCQCRCELGAAISASAPLPVSASDVRLFCCGRRTGRSMASEPGSFVPLSACIRTFWPRRLLPRLARIAWTVLAQERSYEARVTKAAA